MKDWLKKYLIWMLIALLGIVVVYGLWIFFYSADTDPEPFTAFQRLGALISVGAGLLLAINAAYLYGIQSDKNDKDTFKEAIEHLGHKSESVRLGGIYALYGLAPKPRYKKDVHEILCAHIRSKTNEKAYKTAHKSKPSTEIQALLELLSNKQKSRIFVAKNGPLKVNLYDAFLHGASLQDAQLQDADLRSTQLQGAKLRKARLQGADLQDVQLQCAHLYGAELQGANLWKAQLQKADLWNARLQSSDLQEAQLQGADLSGAQLQSADLCGAQLQGVNFSGAQLQCAGISNAQLQGANLQGAWLQCAGLQNAQLQCANLQNAQLQDAVLQNAQLQGAYSTGVPNHFAMTYAERINTRADKETNLDNTVVLEGGMRIKDLTKIERIIDLKATYWTGHLDMVKEVLKSLIQKLEDNHVGKPKITGADKEKSSQYLKNAKTGSYTAEEAEKWIAEYDEAMNSYK